MGPAMTERVSEPQTKQCSQRRTRLRELSLGLSCKCSVRCRGAHPQHWQSFVPNCVPCSGDTERGASLGAGQPKGSHEPGAVPVLAHVCAVTLHGTERCSESWGAPRLVPRAIPALPATAGGAPALLAGFILAGLEGLSKLLALLSSSSSSPTANFPWLHPLGSAFPVASWTLTALVSPVPTCSQTVNKAS